MVRIAVVDCETDPFKYGRNVQPFIWGFYDGKNYYETESTEDMARHISRFRGTVYAHNGGKFDYFFLLPYADKSQRVKVINSRLAQFKIGRATMRDSYNILPVPLARLNKMEFDYSLLEKDVRTLHMPKIREYLRSDCENLYFFVNEFIERYSYSLTLAGAALKEWQKLGGKVPTSTDKFYADFAPYYYGGRVTPFKGGIIDGRYSIYDINSAYPYAMKTEHPTGTRYFETHKLLDRHMFKAFATVECESHGAFPFREENGGINFPHTYGTFNVTGWELYTAIETGTVSKLKIKNAFVFQETICFEDYVDHFYSMKQKATAAGDTAGREFAKLFLNSLYGKFASNPNKYRNYYLGEWGEPAPEGYDYGPLVGNIQLFEKELEDFEKRWFNVATAASITGFVRAFLWNSILQCGDVLYCDTDSIICGNGTSLPQSDRLGDWKLEAECDRVAIAGKKMYAARIVPKWRKGAETHKIASKGVKLTAEQIEKVARGETVTYYSPVPTYSLKSGTSYITRKVRSTLE